MQLTTYLTVRQEDQIEHWECPMCHSLGRPNFRCEVIRTEVLHDCVGTPTIEITELHCNCCGIIIGKDDNDDWYMTAAVADER